MSFIQKLYRGESRYQFIGHRKRWYLASLIFIVISLLSMVFRGFNYGIEFAGGSQFQLPVSGTHLTTGQVTSAFAAVGLPGENPAQRVGSGATESIIIATKDIGAVQEDSILKAVSAKLDIAQDKISATTVSSEWGHDITVKAVEGLIIFLIVVSIYIAIRFQWRMAVGGIVALLHDLLVAAGIYSLVGFQVTPSTVVGLLTILGFSLYDTVVVYDKVAENSKDLLSGARMTFSEAANTAVNQTLMRSFNTSLIALLPVAGLLFIGAGVLGVGTIKDLALILFVGLASGAYSSLFLATPIVVDLTEREPAYKALTKRVLARRASDAKRGDVEPVAVAAGSRALSGPMPAPKPGARPDRRKR
ncbi:MAG TPA: protein translocase subunit SecF [Jatrophihabitantaceae bacterium]|jgi:preprotein translocase subunit SecF|nr:protein translocase subunit SecF [Jatrophihabitantaceae bacterium]